MQSQRLSYLEMGEAIRGLVRYQGVVGLWKGLGSTLLRDVPFSALYWLNYEWFKAFIMRNNAEFKTSQAFVGGAIAGSVRYFIFIFSRVSCRTDKIWDINLSSPRGTKRAYW